MKRCSVKNVFLEFLQNSQENTCDRVSFLIKLFSCTILNIHVSKVKDKRKENQFSTKTDQ